jgi:hypothetical protein
MWVLWSERGDLLAMFSQSIPVGLASAGHLLNFSFFAIVSAMLLIVAVDVPFQLWQYHDKLKMSRQEVKQEGKELEGNPEVKGRIRQLQREAARKRMMAAVPAADVIVTNPTHYAVALAYKSGMGAPKVLAKGHGRDRPQDPRPRGRPTGCRCSRRRRWRGRSIAMSNSIRKSRRPLRGGRRGAGLCLSVEHWRQSGGNLSAAAQAISRCLPNSPGGREWLAPATLQNFARALRSAAAGRAGADPAHPGDDGAAAAALCARSLLHLQYRHFGDRHAGRHERDEAARFLGFPDRPAGHHAAAPVAQRRVDARRPARRAYRSGRRRTGDRSLRTLPGRRQLRGRHRGVHDPGDHQLRRHHQGCRTGRRSGRALHPRRHAGQADGDRCRPQCRPDRRGRGAQAARDDRRGSGLSSVRWTVPRSSSAATPWPAS